MSIKGNTVGMTMPRTNYEQNDKTKPDYLKGKEVLDQKIQSLTDRLDKLVTQEDDEGNSTVTNVATPENDTDAANKGYVDTVVKTEVVEKVIYVETNEDGSEVEHISGGGNTIVNVQTPVEDTDAANKEYVDTVVKTEVVEKVIYVETKEDGTKEEHISGGGNTIVNVATPEKATDAVNKAYADDIKKTAEAAVKRAGDTMGGILNMGGFALKDLPAPTEDGDAVNKGYADAIASAYEQVYVNSNPSAEFAAKDIAVSGLSGWDMIHITFCLSASYSTYRVCKTFVNGNGTFYINAVIPGDTAVQVFRTFVFDDNKISVGDCYAGTSKQNTGLIPVSIHVAKFGKGGVGGSNIPSAEGVLF